MNPKTAEVHNVFYWENTETTAADIIANITETGYLSETKRKEKEIGYYGSNSINDGEDSSTEDTDTIVNKPVITADLKQKAELINDGELYLKVSYDITSEYTSEILAKMGEFKISYTVKDTKTG
ncbi:MAG: hypothetical protein IJ937_05120, partial [Treponema sp.]|nr:hypothetical protein [Treponema sp.]